MLDTVLDAVVTDITGLGLVFGSTPVTVVKRKGVKSNPVDPPYQITVDLAEKGSRVENLAFGKANVRYLVDVTVIAPNQDWLTDLGTFAGWYESISSLFRVPTLLTTTLFRTNGVWDVRVRLATFEDRDAMAQAQLDLQSIQLEVGVTA